MCLMQSSWKLIYIKNTIELIIILQTLQLQVVGTGRQVISRRETACVLPTETKENIVNIFRYTQLKFKCTKN